MTATGSDSVSAKSCSAVTAASVQREPPATSRGRSALSSRAPKDATWVGVGALSTGSARGAAATSAVSVSVSSGRASTTGPGRPDIAV